MAYFPMFVDLECKSCLIVGGGSVAFRKLCVLRDFGAEITVIAPKITPEIYESGVFCERREAEEADLDCCEWAVVIAATNDAKWNHRISEWCRARKIPVNAVDQTEDCSFIFPAYLKKKNLVAAFSSSGRSPVMTQYLKKQNEALMTESLGELNELLGSIRELVKKKTAAEAQRKKIYRAVLEAGLETGELPNAEVIDEIIRNNQSMGSNH